MLHKTRELLVKQRTMSVNALRSHLSEFGIIIAKGIGHIDELLKLAEVDATSDAAKAAVAALAAILEGCPYRKLCPTSAKPRIGRCSGS